MTTHNASGQLPDWLVARGITRVEISYDLPQGWEPLLIRLIDDLIALGWDRELRQVKQKYGGLRVYIGAGTPAMFDRIATTERAAARTCEQCGQSGAPRNRAGWYHTLCEGCA